MNLTISKQKESDIISQLQIVDRGDWNRFKKVCLLWYANTCSISETPPDVHPNFWESDTLITEAHEIITNALTKVYVETYDYPIDYEEWTEEQKDNLDQDFCANVHYFEGEFNDDMKLLFNYLNMTYVTNFMYGFEASAYRIHNPTVVEVW